MPSFYLYGGVGIALLNASLAGTEVLAIFTISNERVYSKTDPSKSLVVSNRRFNLS